MTCITAGLGTAADALKRKNLLRCSATCSEIGIDPIEPSRPVAIRGASLPACVIGGEVGASYGICFIISGKTKVIVAQEVRLR